MDGDGLGEIFEAQRPHLRAVAYRMLGSSGDAEDAVQEAWIRFHRADTGAVDNVRGWLTTVVSRVCLDMLRARQARREEPAGARPAGVAEPRDPGVGPEDEAMLADSVGVALLVVLDTLTPAERLAFVLHDLFGVPFDEVAVVVDRTPEATRQLASRARRRVRGAEPASDADVARRREVVDAFLVASRGGDLGALLAVLDPDVVLRADAAAVAMGAEGEVLGADAVAATFSGRAQGARLATIDGDPGAVWSAGGVPRVVFAFTVVRGAVVAIEMVSDPDRLASLDLVLL